MEFTANQIAQLVNGTVDGDGNAAVGTFAKIEEGHKGALSFLANPKYTHYIYDTKSSIVLVRRDFVAERPVEATLIRVDDPYTTIAALLDMVSKYVVTHPCGVEQPCHVADDVVIDSPETYVGAFSYIAPGAKIGQGAKIYPQCYVGAGVEIGAGTILYPGVKVYYGCKIGANCILHSGVVIGGDGFGFAPSNGVYNKIPQLGIVEIADNVEIGANTTVDRATMGATRIGSGVKLDNLIQVAHNCEIGENTVIAAQAGMAGSSKLGAGCMIGGQVGLAGHIHVGDNVQVGAQSGIPADVPAGSRIMGYPAVNYSDFARQTIHVKNLGKLNARVAALENAIKENK